MINFDAFGHFQGSRFDTLSVFLKLGENEGECFQINSNEFKSPIRRNAIPPRMQLHTYCLAINYNYFIPTGFEVAPKTMNKTFN